eukprot:scaffold3273_cov148-Cylindrotheca_fusiformis.AAC.2
MDERIALMYCILAAPAGSVDVGSGCRGDSGSGGNGGGGVMVTATTTTITNLEGAVLPTLSYWLPLAHSMSHIRHTPDINEHHLNPSSSKLLNQVR